MNPNLNATLSAFRALLVALGGIMATHGLETSGAYMWIQLVSGSIMVVGPAVWGVYEAIANWHKASAVGVQAGINLTLSGQTVDHSGNPISQFSPDASPPKPVTVASAGQIIRDYASAAPPKPV